MMATSVGFTVGRAYNVVSSGLIGFLGLAVEYTARRDYFIDCIAEEFHVQKAPSVAQGVWAGCDVLEAYERPKNNGQMAEKFAVQTKYFSFVPPTSGMFIWVSYNFVSARGRGD